MLPRVVVYFPPFAQIANRAVYFNRHQSEDNVLPSGFAQLLRRRFRRKTDME